MLLAEALLRLLILLVQLIDPNQLVEVVTNYASGSGTGDDNTPNDHYASAADQYRQGVRCRNKQAVGVEPG